MERGSQPDTLTLKLEPLASMLSSHCWSFTGAYLLHGTEVDARLACLLPNFLFFLFPPFMHKQTTAILLNQQRSTMIPLHTCFSSSCFSYFSLFSFCSRPFNGLNPPKSPQVLPVQTRHVGIRICCPLVPVLLKARLMLSTLLLSAGTLPWPVERDKLRP